MRFDRADGIEDVEFLAYSCTRLKSGELLYGTSDGILLFHPDSVSKSQFIPPIVITGFKKLNRQVRIKGVPELLREISLGHDENVFSISFSALSYDMPEFNQYAYKLEGFDKDWIYCGNRREAMYTNLDPGTYTFRVKGSNHDRVWNEAGTSLSVIVNPALWQTWWFRSLAVVMILGFIGFMYQREVRRLKQDKLIQQEFSRKQMESQEAERKRLASELHDGLGQNLLVVKNELQQFVSEHPEPQNDLRRVTSLVQESVESVREISSNLHPHHIERLGFCAAVEAMTENISHSSRLRIECSCDKLNHQLPKEFEIHVYRIIQEALSNIVRHASAQNVKVEVREDQKSIGVIIKDDGCGFDVREFRGGHAPKQTGDVARGFGLASMMERARIIGGTLMIESSPTSGTTIHLTLPQT
jgi:signal transduction histidine kinase